MTALFFTIATAALLNAIRLACSQRAGAIRDTGRLVMRRVTKPSRILVSF